LAAGAGCRMRPRDGIEVTVMVAMLFFVAVAASLVLR
jgi:hypothetical protein